MKLDELQRLAEGAKQDFLAFDIPWPESPEDVMDLNPSRIVCEYFAAMSPDTAKKLIAVAQLADALLNPRQMASGYHQRKQREADEDNLRTALEELKS